MKETKNPFNEKNAASKGMIIVLLFIVVIACVLFFMKGMSSTNSNKDGIKENINYKVKEKNATYISKRPVPKGTIISDRKYWNLIVQGAIPDTTIGEIYKRDEIDYVLASSIETIKQYVNTNLENYYNKDK